MAAKRILAIISLAGVLSAGVFAQDEDAYKQSSLGLKLGANFFSSGQTRRALGDVQLGVGLTFGTRTLRDKWDIMGDIDALWARDNGNRLFLLPLTVGVGRAFGDVDSGDPVPFAAARAGLAYADYAITGDNGVRNSANKFLPTANIEAGLFFGRRVRLSARYDWYSKTDGFDFNSMKIAAAFELVKF